MATKKKVVEIESLLSKDSSTWKITCVMIAMGAANYFWSPTSCGIFVSVYLTMNTLDFLKSLSVLKWGNEPWWSVKSKDLGYVMAFGFGVLTIGMGIRRGISNLK